MFIRLLAVGLSLVAASGAAQPVGDPLAGHWELNVARSRYGGGAGAGCRHFETDSLVFGRKPQLKLAPLLPSRIQRVDWLSEISTTTAAWIF